MTTLIIYPLNLDRPLTQKSLSEAIFKKKKVYINVQRRIHGSSEYRLTWCPTPVPNSDWSAAPQRSKPFPEPLWGFSGSGSIQSWELWHHSLLEGFRNVAGAMTGISWGHLLDSAGSWETWPPLQQLWPLGVFGPNASHLIRDLPGLSSWRTKLYLKITSFEGFLSPNGDKCHFFPSCGRNTQLWYI